MGQIRVNPIYPALEIKNRRNPRNMNGWGDDYECEGQMTFDEYLKMKSEEIKTNEILYERCGNTEELSSGRIEDGETRAD